MLTEPRLSGDYTQVEKKRVLEEEDWKLGVMFKQQDAGN